jgi:hypothetical protein
MAVKKRWLQSVEDAVTQEKITLPWTRGLRRAAAETILRGAEDTTEAVPS